MARIRSIKPEFWTSEQIAECSPNTRLLFIGMWSFCDDYGVHPASCARLKMEVFPADAISSADIRRMIDELTSNGLLAEYEVDGTRYWYVTGWDKHQRPDTKTGKYPRPDGSVGQKIRRTHSENSTNEQRTFADHSPTEKEKEKEKEKDDISDADASPSIKPSRKACQLPDDFEPDYTAASLAAELGVSLAAELPKFRDYHAARGKPMKDWQAAMRTWLRNAKQFAKPVAKQTESERRAEWLADITGRKGDAIDAPARLVG